MPLKNNISIEDLSRAVAVIRSGGGKQAAIKHGLSNGAITTATKAAQALTGQELFALGSHITATNKGLEFADAAENVLNAFHQMLESIRRAEGPDDGVATMHISDLLMATVGIPTLAELRCRPGYHVKIHVHITPASEAIRALRANESQLVVTLSEHAQGSKPPKKLKVLAEIESPLVVVATKEFTLPGTAEPLCRREEISMEDLAAASVPLALPPETYALRRLVDRICDGGHASPVLTVNSISHLRHCARTGAAATIFPRIAAAAELSSGELAAVSLKISPPIQTWFTLYQREGETLSPALQLIAETLSRRLKALSCANADATSPSLARAGCP